MKDRIEKINVAPEPSGTGEVYTASERLYEDAEGNVVRADDPARRKLLLAEGAQMPMADAERLGILDLEPAEPAGKADVVVEEDEAEAEPKGGAKAVKAAPANKAVSAPKADK
jgi:hypothetical protein